MRRIGANLILASDGTFLRDSYIELLENGEISAIIDTGGKLSEIAGLEFYNGILCPGFVNAHCHIELSHLSGSIPPHCGLPKFISEVVHSRAASEDEKRRAMQTADLYMQKSGIVAVGDISNTADSFAIKQKSPIHYHSFIEVFGTSVRARDNFEKAQLIYDQYTEHLALSIVPHAPYSVHPQLFALIAEHAFRNGTIQSIHNQETPSENQMFLDRSGELFESLSQTGFDYTWLEGGFQSSLTYLLPKLLQGNNTLFIHNSFSSVSDLNDALQTFGQDKCYFVLCPLSNLYIEDTLPQVRQFLPYSNNICIGTDSLASNTKLSIIEELKCLQNSFPEIPLTELLQWATINGARALEMQKKIGSFEVGKTPGIILLENIDLKNKKLLDKTSVKVLV